MLQTVPQFRNFSFDFQVFPNELGFWRARHEGVIRMYGGQRSEFPLLQAGAQN